MQSQWEINTELLALLNEAGMSRKGLARGVVELGRRRGEPDLKYNHSSVTRWVRGDLPRQGLGEHLRE